MTWFNKLAAPVPGESREDAGGREVGASKRRMILQATPLEGPHANMAGHHVLVLGPGETRLVPKLTMNVLLILNDCH